MFDMNFRLSATAAQSRCSNVKPAVSSTYGTRSVVQRPSWKYSLPATSASQLADTPGTHISAWRTTRMSVFATLFWMTPPQTTASS